MDITFTPDDPEIGEVEFTLDNETIASNVIFRIPKRMKFIRL